MYDLWLKYYLDMLLTSILIDGDFLGTAIASHMVADYDLETGGSSSVSGWLKKINIVLIFY